VSVSIYEVAVGCIGQWLLPDLHVLLDFEICYGSVVFGGLLCLED
jgi:hypothetical protein